MIKEMEEYAKKYYKVPEDKDILERYKNDIEDDQWNVCYQKKGGKPKWKNFDADEDEAK